MTIVPRLDIHNSDTPMLCRACEARHGGICGALGVVELLRLGRTSSRQEYPAGTTLVAAGERVDRCSNIISGVVKLSKLLPDGRQQIVELQFAPDFLGQPFVQESEVLVEAATDVRLCSFTRNTLEAMMLASTGFENRMHRQALRQLNDARDWMMTLGRKTAAEKVASFLVRLAQHMRPQAEDYTLVFDLPLSRAEIADFLGLTVETVSRHLTKMRGQNVIDVERARHVTVKDLESLKRMAAL